jgi:hypothetical protein
MEAKLRSGERTIPARPQSEPFLAKSLGNDKKGTDPKVGP